ncbi:MAG: VanZ family protein [Gammaproteobacteria bacterium]|nr:VanZ family protein [Gammaproteobacteria bacterium]
MPDINVMQFEFRDKVIHFLIYFILVGWFAQLYKKTSSRLAILIGAIFLGIVIEHLQGMTSYRSFDYLDGLANTSGAVCAFLLAHPPLDSILKRIDSQLNNLLS